MIRDSQKRLNLWLKFVHLKKDKKCFKTFKAFAFNFKLEESLGALAMDIKQNNLNFHHRLLFVSHQDVFVIAYTSLLYVFAIKLRCTFEPILKF